MRAAILNSVTGQPMQPWEVVPGCALEPLATYVTAVPNQETGQIEPALILVVDPQDIGTQGVPFVPMEAFR